MVSSLYALGGGQMVTAILRAALQKKALAAEATFVTDVRSSRAQDLEDTYHVHASTTLQQDAFKKAELILLGVRPQDDWAGLVHTIAEENNSAQVISIIAGVTIKQLQDAAGRDLAVTRIIPNTLTDTGFGTTGATPSKSADVSKIDDFLKSFGKVDYIPEAQIDIYTSYASAGANYVYNFFIALTNAGVLSGLSRQQANAIALENLQGAAKMLEITGKHPYELLDINNSAGGVGITAQHELDASDFAAGLQNAVMAGVRRTKSIGKE